MCYSAKFTQPIDENPTHILEEKVLFRNPLAHRCRVSKKNCGLAWHLHTKLFDGCQESQRDFASWTFVKFMDVLNLNEEWKKKNHLGVSIFIILFTKASWLDMLLLWLHIFFAAYVVLGPNWWDWRYEVIFQKFCHWSKHF